MPETTRITVTLPAEQVTELKKITDNISGYVSEAVARQIRHRLTSEELQHHQAVYGEFTEEELAEARDKISGSTLQADTDADAA